MQLPAHGCHTRRLTIWREHQDGGCSVQDPLLVVGEKLTDAVDESVAAVDARRHEGMTSLYVTSWVHISDPANVAQVEMRAVADAVSLSQFRFLFFFMENNAKVAHLLVLGRIRLSPGRMPGMVNFPSY